MQKTIKTSLVAGASLILAMSLSSCASGKRLIHRHDKDYQKQSQTVPPMALPNQKPGQQPGQQYYPVPKSGVSDQTPTPSLVPPGSQIQQIQAEKKKTVNGRKPSHSPGQQLVFTASQQKAWVNVASAIKQAGFQVLDQDQSLGVYYILDTTGSKGKISKKTPMYRVNIVAAGKKVHVTVTSQTNKAVDASISGKILKAIQKSLKL